MKQILNHSIPIMILMVALYFPSQAQVGIGTTTPNANSILELSSTNKGFVLPRMTSANKPANTAGMLLFQTDAPAGLYINSGSAYSLLPTGAGSSNQVAFWGSASSLSSSSNLTWDNTNGRLGLGIASPQYRLDINAASNPIRVTGLQTSTSSSSAISSLVLDEATGLITKKSYSTIPGAYPIAPSQAVRAYDTVQLNLNYTVFEFTAPGGMYGGAYGKNNVAPQTGTIIVMRYIGATGFFELYNNHAASPANTRFINAGSHDLVLRSNESATYVYTGSEWHQISIAAFNPSYGSVNVNDLTATNLLKSDLISTPRIVGGTVNGFGVDLTLVSGGNGYVSSGNIFIHPNDNTDGAVYINRDYYGNSIGNAIFGGNVGIGTINPLENINTNNSYFSPVTTGKLVQLSSTTESSLNLASAYDADQAHLGGIYFSRTGGAADAHKQVAAIQSRQVGTGALSGGSLLFFTKSNGGGINTDAPRMTIHANGCVGIGTTTPTQLLSVLSNDASYAVLQCQLKNQNANGMSSLGLDNDLTGASLQGGRLFYGGSNMGITSYKNRVGLVSYANSTAGTGSKGISIILEGTSEGEQDFRIINGNDLSGTLMTVKQTGNVGIGTTTPGAYKLYVAGNAWSTGTWGSSDERWKRNITPISDALGKVSGLQGVTYQWRTDEFPQNGFDAGTHYGLIAQQVEKIVPELVKTNSDGFKAVSYDKITALLIEAIKEQQRQIDVLKNENTSLKAQVSKIDQLETSVKILTELVTKSIEFTNK